MQDYRKRDIVSVNDFAPHWRTNVLTGERVLMAPGRASRPVPLEEQFQHTNLDELRQTDPFAKGNEIETPHTLYAVNLSGVRSDDWHVRVVPNKYPALIDLQANHIVCDSTEVLPVEPVQGTHELVIECPDFRQCWSEFSVQEIELVLKVYQKRLQLHRKSGKWSHAVVFRNCGTAAGASLPHAHSQLMFSNAVLPTRIESILQRLCSDSTLISRYLTTELERAERIVVQNDQLLVLCPFASRFQYEHWLIPVDNRAQHFEDADNQLISACAKVLKQTLTQLSRTFKTLAYNVYVMTAPWIGDFTADFRWTIQVLPRLSGLAGFEIGTHDGVNVILPEEAAQFLRADYLV